MTPHRYHPVAPRLFVAVALAVLVAACSQPGTPTQAAAPSGSLGPRPSSPATVEILQPTANSTVTGTSVHIVLKLTGATRLYAIVGDPIAQVRSPEVFTERFAAAGRVG